MRRLTARRQTLALKMAPLKTGKLKPGYIDRVGNFHFTAGPPVKYRETIVDKNYSPAVDYYGVPVLCPNGSAHSVLLGNSTNEAETTPVLGGEAERISYTFTIPKGSSQYSMVINYALVSQATYSLPEQSRSCFRISVFDITDSTYIDCASTTKFAYPTLPEWKHKQSLDALYTEWTANALNLNGYAGKQLRLEFTTNHTYISSVQGTSYFTYAYININEDCNSLITGNAYCTGQKSVTLSAPAGFGDYYWFKATDFSNRLSKDKTLTISPPPPDNTKYALVLHTQNGFACADTLYTVVNKNDASFVFNAKDTLYACAGIKINLTDAAITAGSSPGLSYTYFNDFAGTLYTYHPENITKSGTYFIKATSTQGCTNTLPVAVIFLDDKAINVTDPPRVTFPTPVDVTKTFTHLNDFIYTYFTDSTGKNILQSPWHVTERGTYFIKALNVNTSCSAFAAVNVTVDPPVNSFIKAFNTFTPNNDGLNDYFSLKIDGYYSFGTLKIFGRDGQVVFQTRSATDYWDGNINSNPAPPGTYYWVFTGADEYYHTPVKKSRKYYLNKVNTW